jgi:hypothetical protein
LIIASWLLAAGPAFCQTDWPGTWIELEKGAGDVRASSIQYASGGFAADWNEHGGTLSVDFTLEKALPGALVYLRYARDVHDQSDGELELLVGPQSAKASADAGVRSIGRLVLPNLGHVTNWRWLKIAASDLAAGPQRLFFTCPPGKSAGYLDLVGIVPRETRGLWQPPNDVVIGKFHDKPTTLPPWVMEQVRGPTFDDLLPADRYTGPGANPVALTMRVRNNLVADPLSLTITAQVVSRRGLTQVLPAQRATVPAGQTASLPYSFAWPGTDSGRVEWTVTGESLTESNALDMALVPFEPLWISLHGPDGKPQHLERPGSFFAVDFDVPHALPGALLYVNYSRSNRAATPGTLEIFRASDSAKSVSDPGSELLGGRTLVVPDRESGPQDQWAVVKVGPVPEGHHRFFIALTTTTAAPAGGRERFDANLFYKAGLVPDTDRGLWQPPVTVALGRGNGTTIGNAGLKPFAVHIDSVDCVETGHLFLGEQVLGDQGKPIPFTLHAGNEIVTGPVECLVRGTLWNDHGLVATLPEVRKTIGAGEQADVEYPVRPPGYGWFDLQLAVEAEGRTNTGHSAFGVLHEPHAGPRPGSMFGLSIGDTPADMHVAELIGVKWRRGIPHTNPTDVIHKSGDPFVKKTNDEIRVWNEVEIGQARAAIEEWKQHGVLCLGYVNYNLPWNCLGGAAGGWHKNRPADMAEHVEMVYQLIKPLHDLAPNWEIWNEPWIGGWTWRTGTAQDYRDMTRLIWDRVKPEMPDVKLVGGGSTPYQRDIVFPLNSSNTGYVDGLSTHPYGPPDLNTPATGALEAEMLKRFAKTGGTGGIWATELGTAAFMFAPLPRREADLMVARTVAPLYLLNKLGAGATPMRLFFFASQYGAGKFSGGEHNWWDPTGGSPAPRPALVAYSAMTHFLEDTTLLGDIYATSKGAWALHFQRPDGSSVVVLMLEQGRETARQAGTVELPALDFDAYDYLGRPIGERAGANLRLPVQTWEARYLVSRQSTAAIEAALRAADFAGVPALLVNPRSFTAPLATHPALRVKVENLLPRATSAVLDVVAPPEIQLASSHAELADLRAGEIRYVEFPVRGARPNVVNRYPIQYSVQVNGTTQVSTQVVQVACAVHLTPRLNGDLSEWRQAIPVTALSRGGKDWREITMDPSRAAELLAAKNPADTVAYQFWSAWDETNFYAAAAVPDDTPSQTEPYRGPISNAANLPYLHDCLQLALNCLAHNPDDWLAGQPLHEKSLAADVDYEFCAARVGSNQSELHRLKAPGTNYESFYPTNGATVPPLGRMEAGEQGGPEGRVIVRYDADARRWIYELAIPWTCLHELGDTVRALRPGETATTHLAFAVNDDQGRGRTFWTQEAGDVEAGSYGFSPNWGGGNRNFGGRIITDWGFHRP